MDRAVEVLTHLADEGSGWAAGEPAELLVGTGRLEALRTRADADDAHADDAHAADALARLLLQQGEFDEAIRLSGRGRSALVHGETVDALVAHGDVDRAVRFLTEKADGQPYGNYRLMELLKAPAGWTSCAP